MWVLDVFFMEIRRMKVCFFGQYPDYVRNRVFKKGLKLANIGFLEINSFSLKGKAGKLLFFAEKGLKEKYDVLFLQYPGQNIFWIARLLGWLKGKPLVSDLFVSRYLTSVSDYKECAPGGLRAGLLYYSDWAVLRFSDLSLVDTEAHKASLARLFGVREGKIAVVPVGAEGDLFRPKNKEPKKFIVLYYLSFIPAHGINYVLEAAAKLKKGGIQFLIVGDGPEKEKALEFAEEKKLANVIFRPQVDYGELPSLINDSSICLAGPFGRSEKASTVVTGKTYSIMACEKALIAGRNPATEALLEKRKAGILVSVDNPEELAKAILALKHSPALRKTIAGNGYSLFREKYSLERIGESLKVFFSGISGLD
jgi:glycosyltransferase involved in cell wall biosynthesis